jgi:hypothetical protein
MTKSTGKPQVPPPATALVPSQQSLQMQAPAPIVETAAAAMAAQAEALVKARMTVALARPRDVDGVRIKLLKECDRVGFADEAIYLKPMGGGSDPLEGLSIRFAEAAIQLMGNIDVQCPVVYDDDDKRIVQVTVLDLETNAAYSSGITIMKRVERKWLREGQQAISSRVKEDGTTVHLVYATDDQVMNQQNALKSKAIRTEGLRLVPVWLKEECLQRCYETLDKKEKGTAEDPDKQRKALFEKYAAVGVTPEQVKTWLGHDPDTMNAFELRALRGLYNAIKDGEATWKDAMENREKMLAKAKVEEEKVRKLQAEKDAKKQPPAPETKTAAAAPATAPAPDQAKCSRKHEAPPCADPDCYLLTGDPEPPRQS